LQNIAGTNADTWQQKLAADFPSLGFNEADKLKFSSILTYQYQRNVFIHRIDTIK